MKRLSYFIIALVLLPLWASSQPTSDKELEKQLELKLQEATTAQDSIAILYDLYDIAASANQKHYAELLYHAATGSNNTDATLEALRYLLNTSTDPLEIFEYTRLAEQLPSSDDQWETAVFGRLKKYAATVPTLTESNRQTMLQEAIKGYDQSDFPDEKTEIEELYRLCIFLNASTNGRLYLNYMNRLKELLDKLPESKSNALKNMFYVQLGLQALFIEDYEVAKTSVDEALNIIDQLETLRYDQGRKYARFRPQKYTLLRRRLACFPILTDQEIQNTYDRIKSLVNEDPSLKEDFEAPDSRCKIYYYMAIKDYEKAMPYLRSILDTGPQQFRRTMLSFMAEAAEALGDTNTQLWALKEYNTMLQDYIMSDSQERYAELQIIYDSQSLRTAKANAEKALKEKESSCHNTILVISIIFLVILGILSLWLIKTYRRMRNFKPMVDDD